MAITFAVLATISLTLTSSVNANSIFHNDKKVEVKAAVYLTFNQALQNTWIAMAMADQLTIELLSGKERLEYYTARVEIFNTVFYITGTLEQWVYYFKTRGINTDPVIYLPPYHE